MTLELLRPWVLMLLPLPWLAVRLLKPTPALAVVRVPQRVAQLLNQISVGQGRRRLDNRLVYTFAAAGWCALVLAAAVPVTRSDPLKEASGRDLLLALDMSASMLTKDVFINGEQVERNVAVKKMANAFVRGREGDRVGLIVFGAESFLVAPLTFDVSSVNAFLDEITVGLPGRMTAIGDAIGLAITTLQSQPESSRVMILLSDGNSNDGIIVPDSAAELAQKYGVRIYTISFGSDESETVNDSSTLKRVAETTGGRHFIARTTTDLRRVYAEFDRLEPTSTASDGQYVERDWSSKALMVTLLFLCATTWLELRRGLLQ